MRQMAGKIAMAILGTGILLTAGAALADSDQGRHDGGRRYAVTITNLTRGQVITPPVVIVHNEDFRLFTFGEPAIPELAALAEDGDTGLILELPSTVPSVWRTAVAAGPILPGTSVTVEVAVRENFRYLSVAGMLASSNDAFFAVRGETVPAVGERVVEAEAYDAGSEENRESCEHIPGPPCGNPFIRNTAGAEGYVHVHAGIHGIGDLAPEEFDWRNPVAEVVIAPLR